MSDDFAGDGSDHPAEILWDAYDVPHVYAAHERGLFAALGWAQARNHGNLLLRLYGEARGRAAEYWGPQHVASDRLVRTTGIPARAREWHSRQSPAFRACLDAFADGINHFAHLHSASLSEDCVRVLPVDAVDVIAHTHRVVNFSFAVDLAAVATLAGSADAPRRPTGSNTWAIGPSRSASGNALLLANPHMPWGDRFTCFEAHVVAPGISVYGHTLVGFPVLTMGWNENLGWAHAASACGGWTLYELDSVGDAYRLDGELRSYEVEEQPLRVRRADGSADEFVLTVKRSAHGPVFERDGREFSLRVAGLDRPGALEQWWDMARATDLAEFEVALKRMQIPTFTVMYADREGHIMHLFNGQVPVRDGGDFDHSAGVVRGDTAAVIWTETHPYADLPRLVDPPTGWLQNANDPPWTNTLPTILDAADYPAYMAARGPVELRAQRSLRVLAGSASLTLDDLVGLKQSTEVELATRVLEPLLEAAVDTGRPAATAAAQMLAAWDGRADAGSRGAVLFAHWAAAMDRERMFAVPWHPGDPVETPRGLADPATAAATLERVAETVQSAYGALDVAWGEVFRLRSAQPPIPANGADSLGVLQELWFMPTGDGRFQAMGGDCWTAAVEFGDAVRAMVLTVCGNATQPERTSDVQLELMARKDLRPAWMSREEVLAHLSSRETVSFAAPNRAGDPRLSGPA